MGFKKGQSGNPSGRPTGSGNKDKQLLRERITDFLENNFDEIVKDIEQLKPRERIRAYLDLLSFGLPKLSTERFEQQVDQRPLIIVRDEETKEAIHSLL